MDGPIIVFLPWRRGGWGTDLLQMHVMTQFVHVYNISCMVLEYDKSIESVIILRFFFIHMYLVVLFPSRTAFTGKL
jgi:hypothetical protein